MLGTPQCHDPKGTINTDKHCIAKVAFIFHDSNIESKLNTKDDQIDNLEITKNHVRSFYLFSGSLPDVDIYLYLLRFYRYLPKSQIGKVVE